MRTLILNIFILISCTLFSQDYGYFGKKNTISMSGTFSPRFIANLLNRNQGKDYYTDYQSTNAKSWPVSYGGTISYERQIKKNKFIGVEFSYTNTASRLKEASPLYIPIEGWYGYNNEVIVRTFDIDPIRLNVYNPTVTFSKVYSGNIAPIGLVNTMGVGLLIAKPISKEYNLNYDISIPENYDITLSENELRKSVFEPAIFDKPIWGARFYWQTALNVPLTKNLLWSIAIKGNINVYLPLLNPSTQDYSTTNYVITRTNLIRSFAQSELFNILELKTGLKFAF